MDVDLDKYKRRRGLRLKGDVLVLVLYFLVQVEQRF